MKHKFADIPAVERDEELAALAASQCHGGYGDEYGNHRCFYQDEIDRLRSGIKKVLHEGVQKIEGPYPSAKNNKCKHGRFGYEGCENCIDEFLAELLNG